MNLLVVLGHPDPASLNAAIAKTAVETLRGLGHEVVFHDLYAEGFDPALPAPELDPHAELDETISRHCAELARAEGIVIVHPNWWGQPPALLKGWVDRVFRPKVAYRFSGRGRRRGRAPGAPAGSAGGGLSTRPTPSPSGRWSSSETPCRSCGKNCIFKLCGVDDFHRHTFAVVIISTPEQRAQWLAEVRQTLERLFPADQAG